MSRNVGRSDRQPEPSNFFVGVGCEQKKQWQGKMERTRVKHLPDRLARSHPASDTDIEFAVSKLVTEEEKRLAKVHRQVCYQRVVFAMLRTARAHGALRGLPALRTGMRCSVLS